VGNTSLIRLRGPSEATGCEILAKCEWENPGGSIKDRAAVWMVKEAEEQGILVPGEPGIIVEGTAGNTGIGLSAVGNARGYKTIIVIADTQSQEKKNTLRWGGAQLLEVPAVPFKNPLNYVHVAQRMAEQLKKDGKTRILYADQWGNLANRRAHIESTGPEIWEQTGGKVDAFCCATGTGGTLTGVGTFLKSKNPKITIALTDPRGAVLVRWFNEGVLKSEGDSISEGIGQGRITGNMAGYIPDMALEIHDAPAMAVAYDLLEKEGLSIGGSSAINVAGAMEVAKRLGPGHTIVTVLCDSGTRYASKIYNPTFLRSRNLPVPRWLAGGNEAETEQLQAMLKNAMQVPKE
jgi:cysteine synthase A